MNGIEKITEKIINDVNLETTKIIQEAKLEAQKIIEKYNLEADAEIVKIKNQAEQKEKDILKHMSDMAELEGRKQLLSTKQEVLDEVFKEAFLKIKALEKQDYIDFLSRLTLEASSTGSEAIILSETDRKTIGNDILNKANQLLSDSGKKASLVLSDESRNIDGGLILKSGEVETNCTFEVLYNLSKNELITDVAGILF